MNPRLGLLAALLVTVSGAVGGAQSTPGTIRVESLPTSLSGQWLFRLGHDPAWSSPFRDRRNWQTIQVPGRWDRQGYSNYRGNAWYFLRLFIPSELSSEDLAVDLGSIADADEIFLNGRLAGSSGGFPPHFRLATLARRLYRLPQESLRFGEYNELAIRVYNAGGAGGLLGPAPVIDRASRVLAHHVRRDLLIFIAATFLGTLALFQLGLFLSSGRDETEHLYFGCLLIDLAIFFTTLSTWGPASILGTTANFRLNVATLLAAVVFFIPATYRFLSRTLPISLLALITVFSLGITFAISWRSPEDLYGWVFAAEASIMVVGAVTLVRFCSWARRGRFLPHALCGSILLLLLAALMDLLGNLGLLPPSWTVSQVTLALVGSVPFAVAYSFSLYERWVALHWGEPFERGTGLLPRDRFIQRLASEVERALRSESPLSLAFLRLPTADATRDDEPTQVHAAQVLLRTLRQIDAVGRYQDDTFAVLLGDTEDRRASVAIERLRRAVADSLPRDHGHPVVTAGLAQYRPARHANVQELLDEAEAALYAALSEGGDCTATAP